MRELPVEVFALIAKELPLYTAIILDRLVHQRTKRNIIERSHFSMEEDTLIARLVEKFEQQPPPHIFNMFIAHYMTIDFEVDIYPDEYYCYPYLDVSGIKQRFESVKDTLRDASGRLITDHEAKWILEIINEWPSALKHIPLDLVGVFDFGTRFYPYAKIHCQFTDDPHYLRIISIIEFDTDISTPLINQLINPPSATTHIGYIAASTDIKVNQKARRKIGTRHGYTFPNPCTNTELYDFLKSRRLLNCIMKARAVLYSPTLEYTNNKWKMKQELTDITITNVFVPFTSRGDNFYAYF